MLLFCVRHPENNSSDKRWTFQLPGKRIGISHLKSINSLPQGLCESLGMTSHQPKSVVDFSKKREVVPDLAVMLWHSFGTVAALLQEIISIYPAINPPTLTVSTFISLFGKLCLTSFLFQAQQSNRVCNALALMQCIASHSETRGPFLQGIDAL